MILQRFPPLAHWVAAIAVPLVPLPAGDLSMALRAEDAAEVERAIKGGAPPDQLDPSGRTPLFHAVVTGDAGVVKGLLNAGATVSVAGQSREPLWAAVVNGDREIISVLLESGADAEAGIPGWRPVDAAVLSGRVAVLEMLMNAKPELQLPAAIPVISEGDDANLRLLGKGSGAAGTVNDALMAGHPEMAEFLIRHGVNRGESNTLNHLIHLASGIQPTVPPSLIETLLDAGADPNVYVLPPTDLEVMRPSSGAEVAARLGRSAVLRRYLAGIQASPVFFNRLLTLALLSGDSATIDLVRSRSPEATPFLPQRLEKIDGYFAGPESDPRTSWDTRESGALLLKPRGTAPPAALTAGEGVCVAVIAGEESENEAALLAAVLSKVEGWTVVERDEVETLLGERDFNFGQPRGLVEIGDTLNAGFLILLAKPGEGAERALGAEIVDVATGMVIRRIHAAAADFDPDTWSASLRSEIARAREDWRAGGGRLQAVTLLGVGAIPGMTESDTARSVVSAGLMAEVDASPGCIALTRMQMSPLVEEQTLGQAGSIWQSAWTLEAGVGRPAEDKLVLRLRLKNLRSGERFDAEGEGSPKRMGDLVGSVWSRLAAKAKVGKPRRERGDGAAEGRALIEEAEWRYKLQEFDAAARLADSAHYLGHDGPGTQAMRIRSRLAATTLRTNEHVDRNGPERTGEILGRLPDAVEALDLMNEQFDAAVQAAIDQEREVLGTGGNGRGELATWLDVLVGCRAAVAVTGATPAEEAAARRLDEGLKRWCGSVFAIAPAWDEAGRKALPPSAVVDVLENVDLRGVPWLPELVMDFLAESFRQEKVATRRANLARSLRNLVELLASQDQVNGPYRTPLHRPVADPDAATHVIASLGGMDNGLLARFEKEAELLTARDERRAMLAEEVARMRVAELRQGRDLLLGMVPDELLSRYRVIENHRARLVPADEESYCPGVLASEGGDGELLRNLRGYSIWKRELVDRERILRLLNSELAGAVRSELRPGSSRLRARAALAAEMAALTEAELAALVKPLPQDLEPGSKPKPAASEGVELLTPLPSLPAGADEFIIARVVAQPESGFIWWSGCLVKGVVVYGNSPEESLPALARVTLATGKVEIVTSPSGWGDWKRRSDKMINPDQSVVHASADRLVWHLPRIGVFEVDPDTLSLTRLANKIGKIPNSVTSAANAAAIAGDAFFVVEDDGWQLQRGEDHVEGSQRVLCLRAGQEPFVVVETSRRPESTPLDGPKNQLTRVAAAGDKVRVFANTEWADRDLGMLMVEFDTGAEPAEASVSKDKAEIDRIMSRIDKEESANGPSSVRRTWGDGFSAGRSSRSRSIEVRKGGESRSVSLDYPLPSESRATYEVKELDSKGKSTGGRLRLTAAEFVASGRGRPVIVGETGDGLLVMQRWGADGEMPPLMWRVSKSFLEEQVTK